MITKPTQYSKGKNGAIIQHDIWTEGNVIYVRYGQVGGKLQTSPGKVCFGKNIGKKNETTPEQQADKQAEAMWKHKAERKYALTPEEACEPIIFPMLAKVYADASDKKLRYPMMVQPKLDGLRCLAFREGGTGRVILQSRGGKEFNLPHLTEFLEKTLDGSMILDGELYIHGVSFQTIGSWIKRQQPESKKIQYHTYDCVPYAESQLDEDDEDYIRRPNYHRYNNLVDWHYENSDGSLVKLVKVEIVNSRKAVLDFERRCVEKEDYEGAIARHSDGTYLFTYRSDDLYKVKSFEDMEFKIVGFGEECNGKFAGTANFVCVTKEGNTFEVTPKGSMEQKREYFQNKDEYIGKLLVVKYLGWTDDGIPKIAVGKGIRLEEDM